MKMPASFRYLPEQDAIAHYPVSIELNDKVELSREEALKMIAKVYGVDENDEKGVIEAMLQAADRPAYEDD